MMIPACLVALALLIDVSGSVQDEVFAAQRDGAAAAFEDPDLLRVIEAAEGVAVLVALFDGVADTRLDWTVLRDGGAARRFAAQMRALERRNRTGLTAIGRAIAHGHAALAAVPCLPELRIIDVSTDGFETDRHPPAWQARDAAAADGVVINAIALDSFDGLDRARPGLFDTLSETEEWLRANVATGFVRVANDPADFLAAVRGKVVFELTQVHALR
ncbi:DUF1194 domain-containing protein [Falsiroseomonas oryziterrae]|uniref:DUF1194 domain-containing protein n=1 Tax=Falsiroseomonas oryziterrae TaxID=2911368 RepID=UPI001F463A52|nr:DUF1194 domain-containing protein [Roseomonas sp. NPKOSM-4]